MRLDDGEGTRLTFSLQHTIKRKITNLKKSDKMSMRSDGKGWEDGEVHG